jgi:hypothetical protein
MIRPLLLGDNRDPRVIHDVDHTLYFFHCSNVVLDVIEKLWGFDPRRG